MSQVFALEVQPRIVKGKQVKALRRADLIPAVIYGLDSTPIHVSCPRRPLEIMLAKAGGTHLISLTVEGTTHDTLVREVQRDKIKRQLLHVDFLKVDLSKTLNTEVPLVLVHTPKLGADTFLSHDLLTIEVESLPGNIPEHIEVDCSGLTTPGARLTVADLPRLEGVRYLADPAEVIVRVESMAPEAEEEEAAEISASEPEVIEKGKKEEEEDF